MSKKLKSETTAFGDGETAEEVVKRGLPELVLFFPDHQFLDYILRFLCSRCESVSSISFTYQVISTRGNIQDMQFEPLSLLGQMRKDRFATFLKPFGFSRSQGDFNLAPFRLSRIDRVCKQLQTLSRPMSKF
jgi:hypothetical protein